MRRLNINTNGLALRTLVSCSALSACLSAWGARTYDLTPGGTVQLAAKSYLVDFSTATPDLGSSAEFGSLYRIQGQGSGQQEGYNAAVGSGVPVMSDVDRSPLGTVDVKLGDLGGQYIGVAQASGPVQMVVLALSLDETGGGFSSAVENSTISCVSLDSFQVFVSDRPIGDASSYENLKANARMVFDLDVDYSTGFAEDRSLLLKDDANSSGDSDLFVKIPSTLFDTAGATSQSYVYVYSKFGGVTGYEADHGYEQWTYVRAGGAPTVVVPPNVVPEASTWFAGAAMTSLLAGAMWMRRRSVAA